MKIVMKENIDIRMLLLVVRIQCVQQKKDVHKYTTAENSATVNDNNDSNNT